MQQRRKPKREVNLMTLLANEATADSRKILKKYNQPDAKNCADLEIKLAKLYFDTPDKLQLEKELAEIHPHKNWILKRLPEANVKADMTTEKPVQNQPEVPNKSVAEQIPMPAPMMPMCGCNCCRQARYGRYLNFNGDGMPYTSPDIISDEQKKSLEQKSLTNQLSANLPLIALVGIIGLSFYLLKSKN